MTTEQYQKARFYLETKKYNAGIEYVRTLLAESPNADVLHAFLASYFQGLGRLKEARKSISIAISINPLEYRHFKIAAKIELLSKDVKKSKKFLDRALELNPQDADLFGIKGIAYINGHDFNKAIEYAKMGLKIDAQNKNCLRAHSLALSFLRKADDANSMAKTLLREDPINAQNLLVKGIVSLNSGDPSSKDLLFSALSRQPYNSNIQDAYRISLRNELPGFKQIISWLGTPDKKGFFIILLTIGNTLFVCLFSALYVRYIMGFGLVEWWLWAYLVFWNINLTFHLIMSMTVPIYDALLFVRNPKAQHLYDSLLKVKTSTIILLLMISSSSLTYFIIVQSIDSYQLTIHVFALLPLVFNTLYSGHISLPFRALYFLIGTIIWCFGLSFFYQDIYYFIIFNLTFRVFSMIGLRFKKMSKASIEQ